MITGRIVNVEFWKNGAEAWRLRGHRCLLDIGLGEAEMLIEGSILARTRLYQIVIMRELKGLGDYFNIYGMTENGPEIFQQGRV